MMHIDDDDIAALGYACPEWDDVCEHHARLTRGEAMKRDRDRYQTRRLDLWYVERCRERAHDSREVARVEQESERLYVQPPLPGFDLTPQKRARESTYGTCVATRCEGAEHDSAQLQLFGEVVMSEDDRIWCAPYEISMSARSCAMQRSRSVQMVPHSIEGQRLSRCRDCRAGERRLVVLGVKSKGGDGRVRQWR